MIDWIIGNLWYVGLLMGSIIAAMLIVAPFESLKWWSADMSLKMPDFPERKEGDIPEDECFVVYLTGIGGSGDSLARREFGFLERIGKRLPNAILIGDVFPFSVTNVPLTGERPLAWFFGFMHRARLKAKSIFFEFWIGAKNVCQVAVCSDPRYGPIYNLGIAKEVYQALLDNGYDPRRATPVYLIGYSGGGQVALGAACYLTRLRSPITVITVGGVFSSIPGLLLADHVHCLVGSKDTTVYMGPIMFPGRWPIATRSDWNKARRRGKVSIIDMGPMIHSGRGDYFTRSVMTEDGVSYADHTANVVAKIIKPNLQYTPDEEEEKEEEAAQ